MSDSPPLQHQQEEGCEVDHSRDTDVTAEVSTRVAPVCVLEPLSTEQFESVVHYVGSISEQPGGKLKLPNPSFTQLPLMPLPLWQHVAHSALERAAFHSAKLRAAHRARQKLAKELVSYHAEFRAREEKRRRDQRESRAVVGARVLAGVTRVWRRIGERHAQLQKAEFEAVKQVLDKSKQEDLLRETENLTKKLLGSILTSHPGATGAEETSAATAAAAPAAAPNAEVELEATLSLLDTQDGRRPLRHYQKSALHWMIHLFGNKLNGILADEMGLGKTVQTIALLCYYAEYKNDWGPHLIVVPATVVLNWKAELQRWAPGLKVVTYIGSQKERQLLRKGWTSEDAFHVCITTYNLVVHDRKSFRLRPWGFLVLDEAHQVKNFMSKKWQSLFDLQAEYRLLLTGTPLQNSIMELWSLFHFLLPFASAFRSNEEFKEWFSNPMDEMVSGRAALNEDIVRRLQALLRPFMLRRLKKDVESQLPSKEERVVMCPLSRRQRSLYDDYMQLAVTKQKLASGGVGGVLTVLLALRKVCNHPDLFEERPTVSPLAFERSLALRVFLPRCVFLRDNVFRYRFPQPQTCTFAFVVDDVCRDDNSDVWDAFPLRLISLSLCVNRFAGCSGATDKYGRYTCRHFPSTMGSSTFVSSSLFADAVDLASAASRERWGRVHRFQQQRVREMESVMHYPLLVTVTRVASTLKDTVIKTQLGGRWCPNVQQRVNALLPLVGKFVFFVPAAVAPHYPELVCRLPVGRMEGYRLPNREDLAPAFAEVMRGASSPGRRRRVFDGSGFATELWPVQVRRCFSFPEKRLLIHDCGKLQFLEPALKQLRQEGHRALIFTQFVQMLNILERFLALIGVAYLRLDGSTRVDRRQEMVDQFNLDDRITCMILSTRSGGIGLNLTGADTVIFYDSDWNPTMDLQAQDRCHRIGQTRPVTIYRLISEHTVEENILQKARERKKLNNVVIRGGQFHAIAGVVEEDYEDTSSAFAALSEPVNLRSFFHDLDEDATVRVAADQVSGTDLLREMDKVEDAEDREATHRLESELQQRRKDEDEDGFDDAPSHAGERTASDWFRRNSLLWTVFPPPQERPDAAETKGAVQNNRDSEEKEEEEGDQQGPSSRARQRSIIKRLARKRVRAEMEELQTPLELALTARYGYLCESSARRRYEELLDHYAAVMEDHTGAREEFPRFRKGLPV